jgi:hypothetical protein
MGKPDIIVLLWSALDDMACIPIPRPGVVFDSHVKNGTLTLATAGCSFVRPSG